ncbi:hypothetical protein E2320_007709, partial [Naja naja]
MQSFTVLLILFLLPAQAVADSMGQGLIPAPLQQTPVGWTRPSNRLDHISEQRIRATDSIGSCTQPIPIPQPALLWNPPPNLHHPGQPHPSSLTFPAPFTTAMCRTTKVVCGTT